MLAQRYRRAIPAALASGLVAQYDFAVGRRDITGDSGDVVPMTDDEDVPPVFGPNYLQLDISAKNYGLVSPGQNLQAVTDEFSMSVWYRDISFDGRGDTALNQSVVNCGGMAVYIQKGDGNVHTPYIYGYAFIGGANRSFLRATEDLDTLKISTYSGNWFHFGFAYKTNVAGQGVRNNWVNDDVFESTNMFVGTIPQISFIRFGVIDPNLSNNGNFINGQIGLTTIWNRAITPQEAVAFYNETRGLYGV